MVMAVMVMRQFQLLRLAMTQNDIIRQTPFRHHPTDVLTAHKLFLYASA